MGVKTSAIKAIWVPQVQKIHKFPKDVFFWEGIEKGLNNFPSHQETH